MKTIIFDVETDGFKATKVHCIAAKIHETGEEFMFADHPGYLPISDGLALLESADTVVAHYGNSYDLVQLERLYPKFRIDRRKAIDTCVLARSMFKGLRPKDRELGLPEDLWGTHKLETWGLRLGIHKGDFGKHTDWSTFDADMASYCTLDVEVTSVLFDLLMLAAAEEASQT